ncbi:hypothetical protein GCM10027275_44590 [Rhabdobacter roseus]|uniref:Uncharacterized protein n=1 Tax=Rhabdobacter roseus TaxID=1655419 RepID=A0A840TT73_9BACT|nr:hypothetical protein [Rhabdobacter roseus]
MADNNFKYNIAMLPNHIQNTRQAHSEFVHFRDHVDMFVALQSKVATLHTLNIYIHYNLL